jgi:hypothetical protein
MKTAVFLAVFSALAQGSQLERTKGDEHIPLAVCVFQEFFDSK